AGGNAEIPEIAGGGGRAAGETRDLQAAVVIVIAGNRPGARLLAAPRRCVAVGVVARRPVLVGVVAERYHDALQRVGERGRRVVAVALAIGDIARGENDGRSR